MKGKYFIVGKKLEDRAQKQVEKWRLNMKIEYALKQVMPEQINIQKLPGRMQCACVKVNSDIKKQKPGQDKGYDNIR